MTEDWTKYEAEKFKTHFLHFMSFRIFLGEDPARTIYDEYSVLFADGI